MLKRKLPLICMMQLTYVLQLFLLSIMSVGKEKSPPTEWIFQSFTITSLAFSSWCLA